MQLTLIAPAVCLTTTAVVASIYFASLPNPTELQKQLSATTNAISITGTTALFSLLDDDSNRKGPN